MSFDELKDALSALEYEIDQLLNSGVNEITPETKKKLQDALSIPLRYLDEF
jgi:hypothetical protein